MSAARDATLKAVRRALESNASVLEAARDLGTGLFDALHARQLSLSTARLFRRVYGKRPPGSTRTKRLRKKRLRRMPHFEVIEQRFAILRHARIMQGVPLLVQVAIWNQETRERGDRIRIRTTELRERLAAIATYPEESEP